MRVRQKKRREKRDVLVLPLRRAVRDPPVHRGRRVVPVLRRRRVRQARPGPRATRPDLRRQAVIRAAPQAHRIARRIAAAHRVKAEVAAVAPAVAVVVAIVAAAVDAVVRRH